jgi:hypothetical protein
MHKHLFFAVVWVLAVAPAASATDYSGRNEMPTKLLGSWCFTGGDHGNDVYRKLSHWACPRTSKRVHISRDGVFYFFASRSREVQTSCQATSVEWIATGRGWMLTADCEGKDNERKFWFAIRPDKTLGIGE